jgi:DNA replication and repair protein RecF
VHLRRLHLHEFRSYPELSLEFPNGLTAVLGDNGRGKTNLLEAVVYLSLLRSFRGAPADALVRRGAGTAVVRGEVVTGGREHLIEAEIVPAGRNRVLVDRQRLRRSADLPATFRVSVFAPDDLVLVKGGPGSRRDLLDDAVVALDPRAAPVRHDWDRALRQRNVLLRQVQGRPDADALFTLDVWDEKAAAAGDELARRRQDLVDRLGPVATGAYCDVAGAGSSVELRLDASWRAVGLRAALAEARRDDLRRGVTTVGPHRDELIVLLDGMPARTHASQGEQRSLALALRLAVHRLLTEVHDEAPVLLLDDVFSELDERRSAALLGALPPGQTLISSAVGLPPGVSADAVVSVGGDGSAVAESGVGA